jgi:hypothetical protein
VNLKVCWCAWNTEKAYFPPSRVLRPNMALSRLPKPLRCVATWLCRKRIFFSKCGSSPFEATSSTTELHAARSSALRNRPRRLAMGSTAADAVNGSLTDAALTTGAAMC